MSLIKIICLIIMVGSVIAVAWLDFKRRELEHEIYKLNKEFNKEIDELNKARGSEQ